MTLLATRRGRIQTIGEVLENIYCANGDGRIQSHICYTLGTSWQHLGIIIDEMLRAKLISKEGRLFYMTSDGIRLYNLYRPLKSAIDRIDKKLNEMEESV